MAEDFYKILGVRWNATDEQIGKAYRALVRQYHPDVNHEPGAFEKFQEIQKAFEVLSDPAKRAAYNQTRSKSVVLPAKGVYNPTKFRQPSNSRNLYKPIKICSAVMVVIAAIFSLLLWYSNYTPVSVDPNFHPYSTESISFTKSDETYKSEYPRPVRKPDTEVVSSKNDPYFHKSGCSKFSTTYYNTRDEAIKAGKKPCLKCDP